MIIDDKQDIRELVKEGLEQGDKQFNVISACSGKECLDLLSGGTIPDLILLDIMMPEMSGWNVFAELKENPEWKHIPIVFLTAKSDPYSKGLGKMGAEDYIEKPFSVQELLERINRVLSKK